MEDKIRSHLPISSTSMVEKPKQIMLKVDNLQSGHVIQPLLIDMDHINMAYGYWKSNKTSERAVFEIFFRTNPYQGEFTIFAGLKQSLEFLDGFSFSADDVTYLKNYFSVMDLEFFNFVKSLSAKDINFYSCAEGSLIFPREPLVRIEGPLIVGQLLEATLLYLITSASLMVTNAARYRLASGQIKLYDIGLKRDQALDGGLLASKYSYMGGFDGTSNVSAGKLYNIPITGTHTHAYITAFVHLGDLNDSLLKAKQGNRTHNLLKLAKGFRDNLESSIRVDLSSVNDGELAAFISFAVAFPDRFNVLVDTYDVLKSGLINFCAVSLALNILGFRAIGIRIDSGDLAYLSNMARDLFTQVGETYALPWFKNLSIMVSNNINEEIIFSLNDQKHSIDSFLTNSHVETCQKQHTLDCVYKLVEINDTPRMKVAQELSRATIPGSKETYRLYSESGEALIDLVQRCSEEPPKINERVLCRHPFVESKRAYVRPHHVELLHKLYWSGGKILEPLPSLSQIRDKIRSDLEGLRSDIKRRLNPTPYKVSVSEYTYKFLRDMWYTNSSIGELS